jgi:hypothetical protein
MDVDENHTPPRRIKSERLSTKSAGARDISPKYRDEVEHTGTITKRQVHTNAPRDFVNKWIIVFPVHAGLSSGSEHWTLGILVNVKHDKDRIEQPLKEWHLFHFNSLPGCNSKSKSNAIGIAQYLTYTDDEEDICFREIPVPRQGFGSNDCGLYPSHFMKIFLGHPEFFIKYCLVCGLSLFGNTILTIYHRIIKTTIRRFGILLMARFYEGALWTYLISILGYGRIKQLNNTGRLFYN